MSTAKARMPDPVASEKAGAQDVEPSPRLHPGRIPVCGGKAPLQPFPIRIRTGRPFASRGVSLVEVILFIVIVSVALTGVLGVMNLTTQRSADPLIRKQAIAAAESLLEEILLQNFSPTGVATTPTPANRAAGNFNDVSDYNGYTSTGIYPVDSATPIPGLTGYNVSVSVSGSALDAIPAAEAKLIAVTVTGPDGVSVTLSGYRTNYGS